MSENGDKVPYCNTATLTSLDLLPITVGRLFTINSQSGAICKCLFSS